MRLPVPAGDPPWGECQKTRQRGSWPAEVAVASDARAKFYADSTNLVRQRGTSQEDIVPWDAAPFAGYLNMCLSIRNY